MGLVETNKVKNIEDILKNNVKQKNIKSIQSTDLVDSTTGEIIKSETIKNFKVEAEPDYVKVYLNTMCAFTGLSLALSPILFEFCKYMTWSNKGQILRIDKFVKESVAEAVNLKIDRINQALRAICKSGIFIKDPNYRGLYHVNPYFIARGDWSNIKDLRGEFSFTDGKFTIKVEEDEDKNNLIMINNKKNK